MNLNTCPSPTKLRISTMTATCNLSNEIILDTIYNNIYIDSFVTFIEYANFPIKGFNPKTISDKKAIKKKVFYNQITIILQFLPGIKINVKIFNNGAASITGIKDKEYAIKALEKLCNIFTNILNITYKLKDFNIVLINSDYHIGYEIKRDDLHKTLINKYKIFSSYEPCIYPGVNSKFFWNMDYKDNEYTGRCYCTKSCDGKGTGIGNGQCKKITISTFQSGSVIITGARNIEQINDSYNFINKIFNKYYNTFKKVNAPFLELDDSIVPNKISKKMTNIIYLKKSNITNFNKSN